MICTATSTTQVKALADECEKVMKERGEAPHHIEGHRGGTWVLLDSPALWSTCLWMRPGSSMIWSGCGRMPWMWT